MSYNFFCSLANVKKNGEFSFSGSNKTYKKIDENNSYSLCKEIGKTDTVMFCNDESVIAETKNIKSRSLQNALQQN